MAFFITLFTLFHSTVNRVTKKLHNVSTEDVQNTPREEILPPHATPSFAETELVTSVLKRLGELEDKVDTLQAKPSEMPYEKEELLNAVVCRVDALEAELIATKKLGHLKVTPRVIIGHGFGGKVAHSMVEQAAKPLARPVRVRTSWKKPKLTRI